MNKIKLILIFFFTLHNTYTAGQNISFQHLNTSHGLSNNNVNATTTDKNGLLWIGTENGLNWYDGYTVKSYFKDQYPQLSNNIITALYCDSRNRIWVMTPTGVTMIDDKRQLHLIILKDTLLSYDAYRVLETHEYGIIIFCNEGSFFFDKATNKWQQLQWLGAVKNNPVFEIIPYKNEKFFVVVKDNVFLLDFIAHRISDTIKIKDVRSGCLLNDGEVLFSIPNALLYYNLVQKKITRNLMLGRNQKSQQISDNIYRISKASNGEILAATQNNGLARIDPISGTTVHYLHDPLNNRSINNNFIRSVYCDEKGYVVLMTRTSGIDIFNIKEGAAGYFQSLADKKGNVFDNYVNAVFEDKKGIIWMGAYDRLIQWDRKTNEFNFSFIHYPNEKTFSNLYLEIKSLCVDSMNRLWISAYAYGVGIFDAKTKTFSIVKPDTSIDKSKALQSRYIHDLLVTRDGNIMAASGLGLFSIDAITLKIKSFSAHPLLKQLNGIRMRDLYEDKKGLLWMASDGRGLFRYDKKRETLSNFSSGNGLNSNHVLSLLEDDAGNMFVGTDKGLNIIFKNGTIKKYDRTNMLRSNICAGLLKDSAGNIWMSNENCIIRYHPADSSFQYFNESSGLSKDGFRTHSFQTADGLMIWSTNKGFNYFYPNQLTEATLPLHPIIYEAKFADSVFQFSSGGFIKLPYYQNTIQFFYAAASLQGGSNIRYQYQLKGFDNTWRESKVREVNYNALSPGEYTFMMRASRDGVNWAEAANSISLTIVPPFWRRVWFIVLCTLALAFIIFRLIKLREKIILEKEAQKTELQKLRASGYLVQLEIEQIINHFATSINKYSSIDEMLWDVAGNCISKLNFEDCVIYLIDEQRGVLVQKAAWGPKTKEIDKIINPIEIPLGKGIVGSVAVSGKPEKIDDTTLDERYIVDDVRRFSEITVPIFDEGKVIGIIDSEHSEKNFYTNRHLQILTTIALQCGARITTIKAEAKSKAARIEALENKQKALEASLQSMRLQMNPHFLFNVLNSIQQMILSGDETTATRFLSKFSKLLRLVLTKSDKEEISLKDELEILNLYVELEALRFKETFSYSISCDTAVDAEETYVPALFLQPFVENAIWHGLMHKEGERKLQIHFNESFDGALLCSIEDNGIGRLASAEQSNNSRDQHTGKGLSLARERIRTFNEKNGTNSILQIIDIKDKNGNPCGTRIEITLYPWLN